MISENAHDDVENRTGNRQYLEREEDDVGTHSVMERYATLPKGFDDIRMKKVNEATSYSYSSLSSCSPYSLFLSQSNSRKMVLCSILGVFFGVTIANVFFFVVDKKVTTMTRTRTNEVYENNREFMLIDPKRKEDNEEEEMDERGSVTKDGKFALVVSVYKEWGENNEKVPGWANANASRDNYFVVQPFYQRIEANKPAFVMNKGFESGVYMRYIVDNYYNLPEAVIFVQADGCGVDMNAILPHVTKEILDQAGGFLPLNCLKVMGRSVRMWGKHVDACWREVSKHFKLNLFEGSPPGSDFKINMVCCACFAVKRELLLSTPFEVWTSFYERSIVRGQCVEGQLDIDEGKHETAGAFEHLAHVIFGRKDPLWEPKCFDDFATIVNNENARGSLKQPEVYASEKVEKQPVTIVENADDSWSKLPELVKRLQCNVVSDSKSTPPSLKIFALEDAPSLGHFQMSVVSFFCWLMNQVEDADNIAQQTGRIQLYVSTIVNSNKELQNVADLYYKPFLESIASYAEMNFDIHLSTLDVNDWYTNLHINADRISCYDDNETVRAKEIEVYHRTCSSERHYKGHCAAWFDKQSNVDHFRDFLEKSLNLKEIAVEAMSEVINATRILIFDRAEGYAKSYEDANLVVSAIQNECKQCNVTYFQADLKRGGAKSFEWNCRLIAGYDIIIAAHGSFLANLPCAKPNSAVIEIIWRDITDMSMYEPLAYQLGLKYRRVNFDCVLCDVRDPEDHPVKPDLAELRSALQSLTIVTTESTGDLEENRVDAIMSSQEAKENASETLTEEFHLLSNKLMKNQFRDSCAAACFYSPQLTRTTGLGSFVQFIVAALTFAIEDGCVLIASSGSSFSQLFEGTSLKNLTNCKEEDAKDIKYIDMGASDMDENGMRARYMRYVPQFDDVGFKDSIMLWQSVALSFLMRVTESFTNLIQEVQNEIGWYDIQKCHGAVISMHVRHGDKGSESPPLPLSAYLKELELWLENAEQNQEFKCIFVATDDGDLRKRLEDSPVLKLESGREFKAIGSWQSKVALQKLSGYTEGGNLLDLHLLSRGGIFCFTFSSNFGRLAMHMNPMHLEARAKSSLIPMDYYHHAISSGFFFVHQQNGRRGYWSTVAVFKEKISSKLKCEPQDGCSIQTSQNETCCRLPAKSDYINGVIGPSLSEIFPDEFEKYGRVIGEF